MYLFQAASAAEVETDWGDDQWTLHSDAGVAMGLFRKRLEQFQDTFPGSNVVLCFSDPTRRCFRHDLSDTYKANRNGTRKPLAYKALVQKAMEEWKTIVKPSLEADDVMGIISTRAPGKYVIVSGDKDMQSIPGMFYRTIGSDPKVVTITEAQADRWHMIQTLTGDPVDGYPGVPGVGAVTAAKVVDGAALIIGDGSPAYRVWCAVSREFLKKGMTPKDALLQARLARILRASDWDFDKSEVKLWNPPR